MNAKLNTEKKIENSSECILANESYKLWKPKKSKKTNKQTKQLSYLIFCTERQKTSRLCFFVLVMKKL